MGFHDKLRKEFMWKMITAHLILRVMWKPQTVYTNEVMPEITKDDSMKACCITIIVSRYSCYTSHITWACHSNILSHTQLGNDNDVMEMSKWDKVRYLAAAISMVMSSLVAIHIVQDRANLAPWMNYHLNAYVIVSGCLGAGLLGGLSVKGWCKVCF